MIRAHAADGPAVERREPGGDQRGGQQGGHRRPPHACHLAGRDAGGLLQPGPHPRPGRRRVVGDPHAGQRLRRPCAGGDGRRRRRVPARDPERPQHALHLPPVAAGQRRGRLDRPGAGGRRHLSLPGVRSRRRSVPGAAQRRTLEWRRIVYKTTRWTMASRRQGHRTAGRLPGLRGVPLRVLLRRGRGPAPGQRLLRGVRGLGGARRPPGGRLPAVAGRRTHLAHVPRRTGRHARPAVRDGRDLPEHGHAPRADVAAGAGRAGQTSPWTPPACRTCCTSIT